VKPGQQRLSIQRAGSIAICNVDETQPAVSVERTHQGNLPPAQRAGAVKPHVH